MLLFILIGLLAGILAGMFGIGGGVLIVPALVHFAKMPIHLATGTSLGALLLPVGIAGAYEYYRSGLLDIRSALLIAVGLTVGAYLGAKLGLSLSSQTLQRMFAVFLLFVAWKLW